MNQTDQSAGDAQPYSKDYWDLVFEQLSKRSSFKLALAVLAILYASAIYAPLLANDQPYRIDAVNRAEYGAAHRTLYPAVLGVGRITKQTPEQFLEKRTKGSTLDYSGALDNERGAISSRVETMKGWLGGEDVVLDELLATVDAAIAAAREGDTDVAKTHVGEAKALAKSVRTDYKPLDPAEPDKGGKELVSQVRYPLFASLHWSEILFMVLWIFVLLWPLWNRLVNQVLLGGDREKVRLARKPKFAVVLGITLLCAVGWAVATGSSSSDNPENYKQGITDGTIDVQAASMPPIAFGFAETVGSENFRPPTWRPLSEISEEGYYVRGARVPAIDPVSGFMPPAKPVPVLYGEPELNSWKRHALGTDKVGRDFLTRMLWGGRISLTVGLLSAALLLVIGTVVGAIAGYFGGVVDTVISRLIEVFLCIPSFPLILMISAFVDPDVFPPIYSIVIIIALIRWTGVARLVRAEFLRLREAEFAVAAKALGFSSRRTIFRHILPNAFAPALVAGAFSVASGILTESTLSFLGFGIQPPVASWGSLINQSKAPEHWWVMLFPGLLIFVTITCYNQVGDAFRDAVDPKMQKH